MPSPGSAHYLRSITHQTPSKILSLKSFIQFLSLCAVMGAYDFGSPTSCYVFGPFCLCVSKRCRNLCSLFFGCMAFFVVVRELSLDHNKWNISLVFQSTHRRSIVWATTNSIKCSICALLFHNSRHVCDCCRSISPTRP